LISEKNPFGNLWNLVAGRGAFLTEKSADFPFFIMRRICREVFENGQAMSQGGQYEIF
jgi:hypothetical protein